MKFKTKPVVKEAVPFRIEDTAELRAFMGEELTIVDGRLLVETLEGPVFASQGDWIIKGLRGEFYPCKPDVFDKTYEVAE